MYSLRLWIVMISCCTIAAQDAPPTIIDADYLDDMKEYTIHNADEASAKYQEKINKMDMLEDYPHDHDYDDYEDEDDEDYDDEDYDDEDYDDDEDEDDDDDDDDGGGCGGSDDDDDDDDDDDEDYDDEELTPVQEVIEEFFTR